MPTVNDWDPNDPDDADIGLSPGLSASTQGSSTGGPKAASASKQQDAGYVPWSSFVSANQDVSDRQAGKLQGQVQNDVTGAQNTLNTASANYQSQINSNYQTPSTPSAKSTPASAGSTKQTQGSDLAPGAQPQSTFANDGASITAPTSAPSTISKGSSAAAPWASLMGSQTSTSTQPPSTPPATGTVDVATTPNVSVQSAQTPAAPPTTPWSSFTAPSATANPLQKATSTQQTPGMSAMQTQVRSQNLTPNVAANGSPTPQDLETEMGPAAWSSLMGNVTRAQGEAGALGSETGVQSLIQSGQSAPENTAFDAALINGAGGPGFYNLSNKYGGSQLTDAVTNAEQNSQNEWGQLQGDITQRQAWDKAAAAAAAAQQAAPAAATPAPASPYYIPTVGPDNTGTSPINQGIGNDLNGIDAFLRGGGIGTTVDSDPSGAPGFSGTTSGSGGTDGHGGIVVPVVSGSATDGSNKTYYDWQTFFGGASGAPPSDGANGKWDPTSLGLTSGEWQEVANAAPADRWALAQKLAAGNKK